MKRIILALLLALAAGSAVAQGPAHLSRAESSKPVPPLAYDSAFKGYRPFVDPDLARWREANEEMGRLGGHAGHVPGSVKPRAAVPAAAK